MGDEGSTLGENVNGVVEVSEQREKLALAEVGKEVVGDEQGGSWR